MRQINEGLGFIVTPCDDRPCLYYSSASASDSKSHHDSAHSLRPTHFFFPSTPSRDSETVIPTLYSMDGCSIFREELAIRYPNHGHALWEPDPGGLYDAVEVGDVGFIRRGYFFRLFNALQTRDPPSESDPDSSHGPKYPPKLQPKNPHHIRKSRDNHQYFYSKKVTKQSSQPRDNFQASG